MSLKIMHSARLNKAVLSLSVLSLAGLLIVQLIGAAALRFNDARGGHTRPEAPLLVFDTDSVESIRLSDGDDTLVLARRDGTWVLGEQPELPLDGARVTELLDTLSALERGLPVATTEASRTQLEVADDSYQRRVEINGVEASNSVLYIGTSPGFRQAHVRRDGETEIYAANVNVYDLPVSVDDWLEKSLLAVSGLTRIDAAGFALQKTGEKWVFANQDERENTLNAERAGELVSLFENLRVEGIAENVPSKSSKTLDYVLHDESASYRLVLSRQGDSVRVQRDDVPAAFVLPEATFDTLAGIDRETLQRGADAEPSVE